jgi:SAM-dependent methyltransferase
MRALLSDLWVVLFDKSTSTLIYGALHLKRFLSINQWRKHKKITRLINYISFQKGIESFNLSKKMDKCILCNGDFYKKPLIDLINMPASAQNIPTEQELKNEKGLRLQLYQCQDCGLVQFDTVPVDYYKKVIRAGGGTTTMKNLRREQYADFINRFDLQKKKIIEIGCGQGEFLSILSEFDVNAFGIEYDQNLADKANKSGLVVYKMFIDNKESIIPNGPYDAFVQFNFLEHQPNPNEMLKGIYHNLTENGVGLVTVPSLEYILKHDGYYELIRDHIAYYSEETLKLLFQKNGFDVVECKTVNKDTHSILVKKRIPLDISEWLTNYTILKEEFDHYLQERREKKKTIAIWGAGHQGFTIASTLELSGKVSYIIDSAPFKQGKFAPASHIRIVSPDYFFDHPVDAIIIIAPGYTDEIAKIIRHKYGATVEIVALRYKHLEIL